MVPNGRVTVLCYRVHITDKTSLIGEFTMSDASYAWIIHMDRNILNTSNLKLNLVYSLSAIEFTTVEICAVRLVVTPIIYLYMYYTYRLFYFTHVHIIV